MIKAFDMLEWSFWSQVLHKIGFKANFISFIQAITSNANSIVLINDKFIESFQVPCLVR